MKKSNGHTASNKKSIKPLNPSLGPVNNLEEFLRPDWWRRIFNSMYLKTDADVVEDRTITTFELDLFSRIVNFSPDDVILDLACGQGRHSLELGRRGFKNVFGLDRSHFLINKARQLNSQERLNVSFKEGDARKLPYADDTFNVVMILGNSFGYFETVDDDVKILKEVMRVLKPKGKFLLDVADGDYLRDNFSARSWEWIDKNHFVCRERSLASDRERLISREVISNTKKGVIVDQFYAERLYDKERLNEILSIAGFKDVKVHTDYKTDSGRNQDLGMMERRIIVSAQAIKTWSVPKQKNLDLKNVTVLLGDPKKSDIIKPDTVFDEDDYKTIDELKLALGELKGYKFSYLDNHDTLLADLVKNRSKIDYIFNLCDEGYGNNPRHELHVPAILEMLKIPYTGSNPQCLAYCYDKSLIRGIAKEMDIPVAEAFYIKPEDNVFEMNIGFPVIAKPNYGDSSFGITQKSVAYNVEELNDAIVKTRKKFGYEKPILVEEFLTGKDITVGIIGNSPESYMVLPIIEEDYSQLPDHLPKICGYEAKWLQDSPYFKLLRSIECNLPANTHKQIIAWCLKLTERLDCMDYVRLDWRLDSRGLPRLLEVNPNPGWCWDGHLAKMAAIKGMSYSEMLKDILSATENRLNGQMRASIRREKAAEAALTE